MVRFLFFCYSVIYKCFLNVLLMFFFFYVYVFSFLDSFVGYDLVFIVKVGLVCGKD